MIQSQLLRTEQEFLLVRLESVKTTYHQNLGCMDGTRESLLKQLIAWAAEKPGQKEDSNIYWVYGLPGIGKTSLAHSICASLDEESQLAGAFFCRRDDGNLSEPRNILPTLIHKLAIIFPPFRRLVAERLRNDPNLAPASMKDTLLLELVRKLPRTPKCTLLFVIDALDECGSSRTRPSILRALTEAATHAPWLKIIITSRPEVDIEHFFTKSPHLRYDLTADHETTSDLRIFAQARFHMVASERYIQIPWPDQSLLDKIVSQAAGLFIFVETIALALEHCKDPTEYLEAALRDAAGAGLSSLYKLYSSILSTRRVHDIAEFRRVIGVLLAAAPYHPLCDEAIAELAGVRPDLVKMWVADLNSLLYRDEGADGGIRVRHLSISDFFLREDCPSEYHVDLREVNVDLGISCLNTMIEQLRFNICKLEDSRLTNVEVKDLPLRIGENISDALKYSSLYWSYHLCRTSDKNNKRISGKLRRFFEGPYSLFWVEVLSVTGMVSIGVPSLRRVISTVAKVSTYVMNLDARWI